MKKIFAFIISLTMLLAGIPAVASAAGTDGGSAAGTDGAASASAVAPQGGSLDGAAAKIRSYGHMKKGGNFVYKDADVTIPEEAADDSGLPVRYDLRTEGRSTSVKDQGRRSACWAFASLASLESNLITKGIAGSSVDLSEAHLAYFLTNGKSTATPSKYAGLDLCYSDGEATNYYAAGATLTRGFGPLDENDMPYYQYETRSINSEYTNEYYMTRSKYELQDIIYVSTGTTPEHYDPEAFNTVKKLIMENGAVASKLNFPGSSDWQSVFGSTKPNELKTYYSTEIMPTHAVTIIGWDDEFNDFESTEKPAGPGAWIIKDSYGDLHGDGYFYVSYYSPSLGQYLSFNGQKNTGREIYQYDGVGVGDNMLFYNSKVIGSNTYTARSDIMLDQMMTYAPQAGCSINVKIYAMKNGSSPAAGVKLYDKTFNKEYAGYSRTDLGKKIGIAKGAKFSVFVSTKTPGGAYFIPFEIESIDSPMNIPAIVKSGQSYINIGGNWIMVGKTTKTKDQYGDNVRLHNALIKVFGNKSGTAAQKISVKTKRQMKKGKTIKLNAKRTKGAGKLVYQTSSSSKATVTAAGIVKAKKKGTVKITVYALPTTKYKSAKKVVTIKIK